MKSKINICINIFIILYYFIFISTSYASDYDFRNIKWGMTIEQVKNAEKIKGKQKDNKLFYFDKIYDKNFQLIYFFDNNKLHSAMYRLIDNYGQDYNKYFDTFISLLNIISDKYGEPKYKISGSEKYKKMFVDNPNDSGFLLADGSIQLYASWNYKKTGIVLAATNEGKYGIVKILLMYSSLSNLNKNKKQNLNDKQKF